MGPTSIYASTRHDAPPAAASAGTGFWGADGFGFADVLDMVNPLQHLPVIGTLYRALTGDTLSPGARVAGGALYGGVAGLVGSVVNAMVEETAGRDLGSQLLAAVAPADRPPPTVVAAAIERDRDGPPPAVPAPAWLDRMPRSRKPFTALAAEYTRSPSTTELLTAMRVGLDKYEQAKPSAAGTRFDRRL